MPIIVSRAARRLRARWFRRAAATGAVRSLSCPALEILEGRAELEGRLRLGLRKLDVGDLDAPCEPQAVKEGVSVGQEVFAYQAYSQSQSKFSYKFMFTKFYLRSNKFYPLPPRLPF